MRLTVVVACISTNIELAHKYALTLMDISQAVDMHINDKLIIHPPTQHTNTHVKQCWKKKDERPM
jgi:hypothetical protein